MNDGTLTSGRIPVATTNGRLTDDADLAFATDTLTATKILAPTSLGVGSSSAFSVDASGIVQKIAGVTNTALNSSYLNLVANGGDAYLVNNSATANSNVVIRAGQTSGVIKLEPISGTETMRIGSPSNGVKAGTSTGTIAKIGGVIFDHYTDSTVGGAEADIYSDTLPANIFATNGDKVSAMYSGNFVTVGTELTQLKVYLAGTAIWDSTGVAPATGTTSWKVNVDLIRVSSTVIRYTVSLSTTGATGYVYAKSGELTGLTLSGTNILKITGTSTGVGSGAGDIVGKMSYDEFKPAA
jgi:hypothetical protein